MSAQNQLEEVKKAMQQAKDRLLFERYQAVYLFLSDYKRYEIAQILNRNTETVGIYIATYKERDWLALPSAFHRQATEVVIRTKSDPGRNRLDPSSGRCRFHGALQLDACAGCRIRVQRMKRFLFAAWDVNGPPSFRP